MSSIMRWRSGLMGLSDIAKAPVSHGVEPHDLETGSSLRSRRQSFGTSRRPSPRLPRERFRSRGDSGPPAQTLSAASRVKPPAKSEARTSKTRSAGDNKSYDHADLPEAE